jgi:hypothetical protein
VKVIENVIPMFARRNRRRNFPTLRLTFSYEGGNVRLMSQQAVEMICPDRCPPPSNRARQQQPGFFYELRDTRDQILHEGAIPNPVKFDVELRTDDSRRPLAWQKLREPKGCFVLLVPDLAPAHTIVLFSSPLDTAHSTEPARELARFMVKRGSQAR